VLKPWAAPALLPLALVVGCAAEPFTRAPLPPLNDPNPRTIPDRFLRSLPNRRFALDDTVIIQAPFRQDVAVLGELVVDRSADRFELVGLNHLAVTLFKLGGDHQHATIDFAVPELTEHRDLLLDMGQDIRRMYFDLVPGETAVLNIGKTTAQFSENTPEGRLVYEFGGEPAVLLDKHLDGVWGTIWRVTYYQYTSPLEGLYPRGVVMDNNQYHYRIIVKNRAMQLSPPQP
jgi:hypothetical protein